MSSSQILDREFLEIRAKLIEVAASLDRLDRADGSVSSDSRMQQLGDALDLLRLSDAQDRAEKLQLIFSLPYDDNWSRNLGIPLGQ